MNILDGTALLESFLCAIWRIPEGFAILVGALIAVGGAVIAYKGVTKQIQSDQRLAEERRSHERAVLDSGLDAELRNFAAAIAEACSVWNRRLQPPVMACSEWPVFPRPLVYEANVSRIGLLREPWIAAALISFYGNLFDLNEMAKENAGRLPADVPLIAGRLQKMVLSAAEALDGLSCDKKLPIFGHDLNAMITPDGTVVGQNPNPTTDMQTLLRQLGGASS